MSSSRVIATYFIETPYDPAHAAAVLAGEQSTGTFVRVPGETDELRERHGARVESVSELGESPTPALPFSKAPAGGSPKYRAARVVVSFPIDNMGTSLPNLLATVAGNLFELREFSGLRLLDLELPEEFAAVYPGPQFGVEGTRRLAGVWGRPLIGTIVKPSVGLSPEQTAALVRTLVDAGLDFIKDDELMANPPHSPFERRVDAVMRVIQETADRTGRKAMYAFNLTDEVEAMCRHAEYVLRAGGTCVMASVNSIGLPGVAFLRRHCALPIHAHRNGWGYLTRAQALGFAFRAWHKLWRVAGVDHIHTNGIRNKFWEPDDSVVESARACAEPVLGGYQAMPVLSAGQWAEQAPDTYRRLGTVDLLYLCGGGIVAHPGGIAAGVASVRQAWDAALEGVPLPEYAAHHAELRQALAFFGGK
ncbi:MAG: ribulose-bisphosphate carboxylase large subunit family protein [Bryobacteraceae bacterium]|nr:ribulose-bisphosphate carboxylase large subunit family protein [Bryobacteraceae bacterium]